MKKTNILTDLREAIEKEIGMSIDTRSRVRKATYGRAMFCRIARDMNINGKKFSLNDIAIEINRNHSCVYHSIQNTFDEAMKDKELKVIYRMVRSMFKDVTDSVEGVSEVEVKQALRMFDNIDEIVKENKFLKEKIALLESMDSRLFSVAMKLNSSQLDEVMNKVEFYAKAVYA